MIVKLIEVKNRGGRMTLEEVFVNSEQVVFVRPSHEPINEGSYPEGLDKRTEFSKVYLDHGQNGLVLTVVGTPSTVESKINDLNRQLLKG
jgi:hypothetical protein